MRNISARDRTIAPWEHWPEETPDTCPSCGRDIRWEDLERGPDGEWYHRACLEKEKQR